MVRPTPTLRNTWRSTTDPTSSPAAFSSTNGLWAQSSPSRKAGRAWPRKSSDSSTNQSLPGVEGTKVFSRKPFSCSTCAWALPGAASAASASATAVNPMRLAGEESLVMARKAPSGPQGWLRRRWAPWPH